MARKRKPAPQQVQMEAAPVVASDPGVEEKPSLGKLVVANIKKAQADLAAAEAKRQELIDAGYPIVHAPGVTETKPGRFKVELGVPGAGKAYEKICKSKQEETSE